MAYNNPKELFVKLLSDLRLHEEKLTGAYKEIREVVQDQELKESLDSLLFLGEKNVATLDQCFKIIGKQPVDASEKMLEPFIENFRKEVNEIKSPVVKTLFVAAKANHLLHFRISEYFTLIAMSDMVGYRGVGLLLESTLASKMAFFERTRRRIRSIIEKENE